MIYLIDQKVSLVLYLLGNLFENIGSGKHLSAEEVHEKLVKSSSKVSLATIYRTLRLLVQMGLLHELELSEVDTDMNCLVTIHRTIII